MNFRAWQWKWLSWVCFTNSECWGQADWWRQQHACSCTAPNVQGIAALVPSHHTLLLFHRSVPAAHRPGQRQLHLLPSEQKNKQLLTLQPATSCVVRQAAGPTSSSIFKEAQNARPALPSRTHPQVVFYTLTVILVASFVLCVFVGHNFKTNSFPWVRRGRVLGCLDC